MNHTERYAAIFFSMSVPKYDSYVFVYRNGTLVNEILEVMHKMNKLHNEKK